MWEGLQARSRLKPLPQKPLPQMKPLPLIFWGDVHRYCCRYGRRYVRHLVYAACTSA